MSTLDRYIARQYLFNIFALIAVLFSFVVTIDVALNIGRFLRAADRIVGDREVSSVHRVVTASLLVLDLWWPKLLQLFSFLIGLVLVGAMGFTLSQLVRNRELVAVLASGNSLRRVGRPMLIVALAMLTLRLINQEFVLCHPGIAPLLVRDHGDVVNRDWDAFPVPPTVDGNGWVLMARSFDHNTQTLEGVHVWVRDSSLRAVHRVSADRARHLPGGGWELEGSVLVPLKLEGDGGDAGVLAERPGPATLETDIDPSRLLSDRYTNLSKSWVQINRMLENPMLDERTRERLVREKWSRVSNILSTLLALAITMPFFLLREPKNMLVQSLKCAPVGIVALVGGVLGASASIPGLPAGFGVFVPVIVLTPLAVGALFSIRT